MGKITPEGVLAKQIHNAIPECYSTNHTFPKNASSSPTPPNTHIPHYTPPPELINSICASVSIAGRYRAGTVLMSLCTVTVMPGRIGFGIPDGWDDDAIVVVLLVLDATRSRSIVV